MVALANVARASARASERRAEAQRYIVSLDVKDADVRDVLHSLQKQCEIKNMVIDKEVEGKATFILREVPCETAFKVVFVTFGLRSQPPVNSVMEVYKRR